MAVSLGSAYGVVGLSASGVKKGAQEAEGALMTLEKKGGAAMVALGLSFGAITAGMAKMAKETVGLASEFESSVTRLSLAARGSGETFDELHDAAIAVGGDSTLIGVTASSASEAMTGLYKSGLSTTAILGDLNGYMAGTAELGGALRASIDLAAASELSMVEASDLAVVVLSTFGAELETDAEKAEFVNAAMDNFVKAADASVAEVSDLKEALSNIGPDAARLGFSIEDVNTALALLSTRGIRGAEAGTALKSMLMNLSRQTPKVKDALAELNVQLYDSRGTFLGLPAILGQLETAFSGLTDEQRDQYMQTLAGTYGIKALSTLVAEGTDGWDRMSEAIEGATGIQEKAQAIAETFAGRVESLKKGFEVLGIEIGEKLMPVALDWVEWAIGMVEEHGPALIGTVEQIAGAAGELSEILQGNGTAAQNTGIQLLGLGTTAVGAMLAIKKLTPVATGVATALKDAYAGAQLMAGGASAAEVASLGWTAALGPLVLAVGALAVALYAANKAAEIHREAEEKETEVAGQWTQFLKEQAETMGDATSVADAYISKQEVITRIYEEGGLAAQLFIDKQDVVNAGTGDLSKTLLKTATSYEDYKAAVQAVNQAQIRQALATRGAIDDQMAQAVARGLLTKEAAQQRIQEVKLAQIQEQLVPLLGETSFALARGADSMESGFLAAQMMTGALDAAGIESGELAVAHGAMADEVIEDSEAIQTARQEAWATFAEDVRTAVGAAVTAYREGNAEMLAAQQEGLAQMLWSQTDKMLLMGQITKEQAAAMKLAIGDQFGIMVDEVGLTTDALLGKFAAWAANAGTEAQEVVDFVLGIGAQSAALAANEEATTRRMIEEWRYRSTGVTEYGTVIAAAVDEMASNVGQDIGSMGQEFETTAFKIGFVEAAMLRLPTSHTFTVYFKTEGALPNLPGAGPEDKGAPYGHNAQGTDNWRGGWSLVGEEGPELIYLNQGAQVLDARETASMLDSVADLAASMRSGGLSGGAALLPAAGAAQPVPPTVVQMTAYVRDDLDIELLARKVAEHVRRRA